MECDIYIVNLSKKCREIRKLNSRNFGQIPEILDEFPKFSENSRTIEDIPERSRIG